MKDLSAIGMAWQLSWTIALTILIPLGAGLWLDRRLGTAPLFVFVGAIIGILASTVSTVRIASRAFDALGQPPAPPGDVKAVQDFEDGKEDRA
jgi:F0F1-type ATP synthase assembly protein I